MSERGFVLAIDQGTTSTRAIVFDAEGWPCASAQVPLTQIYSAPGEVEHDPEEIWRSVLAARTRGAARGVGAGEIAAIGITNQRETTVVWERATGKPLANAIVWQDRRTAKHVRRAESARAGARMSTQAPGSSSILISPRPSSPGCSTTCAGFQRGREKGEVCFGTVDSFFCQADRRQGARDRREQRRAHMLYDISARRMGRRASRPPRHPARRFSRSFATARTISV